MLPTMLALLALAAVTPVDLEKSCNASDATACFELGTRVHDGIGARRDLARAADLFRKACKGKHRDACADDARALALGEGQPANPRAAIPALEKMCKQGQARACGNLGDLFLRGLGGPQDSLRGEKLLEDACGKKVARACANLVTVAYRTGDAERAEQLAEQADDLGDPVGYGYLGDLYATSDDVVRAIVYFRHACDAGLAHGCTGQGFLLRESGVDEKKARELLQRGCDGGDPKACEALHPPPAK
jgi:TPR repeat protein